MRHYRYALHQLRQVGLFQFCRELRLPRQNDLKQFAVRRFEIREKTDRFENCVAEVLRFIDNQNELLAVYHFIEERFVQSAVHCYQAHAVWVDTELAEEILHELQGIALCLKKVRGPRRLRHLLNQLIEQSGFAHAWVGDQGHEAAAAKNAIAERIQRSEVGLAWIQIGGVRSDTERFVPQFKKFEIHRVAAASTLLAQGTET